MPFLASTGDAVALVYRGADGGGTPAPREIFVIGDADPSYAPNMAITWTDGGFLVVWDEACTGGSTCLSFSFIEVD